MMTDEELAAIETMTADDLPSTASGAIRKLALGRLIAEVRRLKAERDEARQIARDAVPWSAPPASVLLTVKRWEGGS